jgi:hypothetical protein
MTDFLTEVEEDLKRERYEKLWAKYSNHLFAVLTTIIVGVAAFQYWQKNESIKSQAAGTQFEVALQNLKADKNKEAADLLAAITADGGRYKDLARVKLASELAKTDFEGAKVALDAISNDTKLDQSLRDLAALRVAFMLAETAPLTEITKRVERLANADNPFRFTARELIGLSAFKNNNLEESRKQFTLIQTDSDVTEQLKARAALMLAVLGK